MPNRLIVNMESVHVPFSRPIDNAVIRGQHHHGGMDDEVSWVKRILNSYGFDPEYFERDGFSFRRHFDMYSNDYPVYLTMTDPSGKHFWIKDIASLIAAVGPQKIKKPRGKWWTGMVRFLIRLLEKISE